MQYVCVWVGGTKAGVWDCYMGWWGMKQQPEGVKGSACRVEWVPTNQNWDLLIDPCLIIFKFEIMPIKSFLFHFFKLIFTFLWDLPSNLLPLISTLWIIIIIFQKAKQKESQPAFLERTKSFSPWNYGWQLQTRLTSVLHKMDFTIIYKYEIN